MAAACLAMASACTQQRERPFDPADTLVPAGYQRAGAPEFSIVYYPEFREIHIYGVGRGSAKHGHV